MGSLSQPMRQRLEFAGRALEKGMEEIREASKGDDPVEQRRCFVRAARHFRGAADLLDDEGRLSE